MSLSFILHGILPLCSLAAQVVHVGGGAEPETDEVAIDAVAGPRHDLPHAMPPYRRRHSRLQHRPLATCSALSPYISLSLSVCVSV
jgi:hypothetical protein